MLFCALWKVQTKMLLFSNVSSLGAYKFMPALGGLVHCSAMSITEDHRSFFLAKVTVVVRTTSCVLLVVGPVSTVGLFFQTKTQSPATLWYRLDGFALGIPLIHLKGQSWDLLQREMVAPGDRRALLVLLSGISVGLLLAASALNFRRTARKFPSQLDPA